MKRFRILVILLSLSIFIAGCSKITFLKGSTRPPILHTANFSQMTGIPHKVIPLIEPIHKNLMQVFAVCGLLALLLLYRFHKHHRKRKRLIRINDDDLALLGLAADTLNDLWRRLQIKNTAKIIPFPSGR